MRSVAQHRLTSRASTVPATVITIDSPARSGRTGQHRATTRTAGSTRTRVGVIAAAAGAIGMTVAGASQAAAHPSTPQLPANVQLPANLGLPENVVLPAPIDDLARNLLPPTAVEPGKRAAVAPTTGTVTSGYGARWGTTHYGVDIANEVGTPVYAVTDGTVLESGPASGFGQWIRVRQDDGTVGVFGHVDQSFVHAGQQVRAGDQIGTIGNRGNSTGPHLHYEVWESDGTKINPQTWLAARGVNP